MIATGRNTAAFDDLRGLGADVTLALTDDLDAMRKTFMGEFAQGVTVVLDYVWGPSAPRP